MQSEKKSDIQTEYDKAQALYEKGEYQKALEQFNRIAPEWPDLSVLNYIGCCYIGTQNYEKAEEIFRSLSAKSPDWERPYFNLARALLEAGKEGEACAYLQRAIALNPSNADSYFYLGVYYRKKRQWDRALDCFLKSEKLDGRDAEVHINLSACYAETGELEKSLSEAQKALEQRPSDPDALFNVSRVLIWLKEYEKAFQVLRNHQESVHGDLGLLKNLFVSALRLEKYDVCTETAKSILAIDENDIASKKFLTDIQ
ncbi:MAG: tetratricopeptide repeat protein [Acutalibacteraceae bacterium]